MTKKIATPEEIQALHDEIKALKDKLGKKGLGRKEELLAILQAGRVTLDEAAEKMSITSRNVSTLKSYLKADGWNFGKDSKGRIFIETDEV